MKLRSKIQILAVLFILCIGMTYPIMPAFATELIDEDTGGDDNAVSNITDNVIDNSTDDDLNTSQKTDGDADIEKDIPVSDIEISDHEDEVEVGNTLNLTATVLPATATDSTVMFRSSDMNIATVNSSGEVKGISKGSVTIYVSAGSVTKEVNLTVKVKTTVIKINKDYLVLKQGEAFKLSVSVSPAEADQGISFKSTDSSVASVSDGGVVTAKSTGTATIIVSNGDLSNAVSVIVNKNSNTDIINPQNTESSTQEVESQTFDENINASEVGTIDTQMLYELYTSGKSMKVTGDGYSIIIDGKKIVNYNNELDTDIKLKKANGHTEFELNNGKYLCGEITIHIDDISGKYLYLYNNVKHKYELVSTQNMDELKLSTPGKYMITAE
ncbi:Ig-like domain-containing protein, partial [Agathobacter sp.]